MRTGDLEAVIHEVWTDDVMLRGMPEGTRFYAFVNPDGIEGFVAARLYTDRNISQQWIDLRGEWSDPGSLIAVIDAGLARLRDFHWRATFNVWPGWRY